jgi:hypothetical protein
MNMEEGRVKSLYVFILPSLQRDEVGRKTRHKTSVERAAHQE